MVKTRAMMTQGVDDSNLNLKRASKPKRVNNRRRGKDWEAILECVREAEEAAKKETMESEKALLASESTMAHAAAAVPVATCEPPRRNKRGRKRPSKKTSTVQIRSLEMEELYHPPSGHSIPAAPYEPSKAEMRALRSSRSPPRAPPNSPCSWSVTFSALDPVALYTSLDVNSDTSARIRKPSNCTGNRGTIKRKQLSRGSNEDDDECILLGIYPPKDSFPTRNHFTKTLRTTEEICLDLPEVSIVSYSTNTLSSTKHQAALATSPTEEEICLDLPVVSILSSAPSSDGNFPPNISTALAQVTHLETGANNEGACLGDYQVSTINFMKKINAIMEGKGFPEECFNALQKFYETVQAFLKKNQDPL